MTHHPSLEKKICPPGELPARVSALSRPLVFTNGVFDVLHRGHVTYLAESRALGSSLMVALNSDASVRRLGKGPDRPINTLEDRLAVVAALESVSLATWFKTTIRSHSYLVAVPMSWSRAATGRLIKSWAASKWRAGAARSLPFRSGSNVLPRR